MTTTIRMNLSEWPAHLARLGKEFMPAAHRGLLDGAQRCLPLMVQRTDKAPPASPTGLFGAVNFGHYRRAWRVDQLSNGAMVYNMAPYAGVIEYGRRPAAVSKQGLKQIQLWAKRRHGLDDRAARAVAWSIGQRLRTNPLWPRHVMTGALGQMRQFVRDGISRELARAKARP